MEVKIHIKNLAEIRQAFSQAPTIMRRKFSDALKKAAITVQRESMIRTPVDTGRLRASHMFNVSGLGLGMQATVQPTADYAIFVHEGTRFMRGRPFLKQGADAAKNDIQRFFTDALQDGLNEIGRMT